MSHPAQDAAGFDAAAWLADWSDHGGIACLACDRLYLARWPTIDLQAHQRLDALRTTILHQSGGEALAGLLSARREGEA